VVYLKSVLQIHPCPRNYFQLVKTPPVTRRGFFVFEATFNSTAIIRGAKGHGRTINVMESWLYLALLGCRRN